MRTKYDDKKLYITTCAYHAQSDMDISLKPGDLVGVIVNKDPMGNSDRWFIDNGGERRNLIAMHKIDTK